MPWKTEKFVPPAPERLSFSPSTFSEFASKPKKAWLVARWIIPAETRTKSKFEETTRRREKKAALENYGRSGPEAPLDKSVDVVRAVRDVVESPGSDFSDALRDGWFFPRLHARITDADAVGFVPDHFAFSSKNFKDGIFSYSFDVSVWASRKDKLREWEPFVRALQLETNMVLPKGCRAVYRLMFRENYEIPGQMEGPRAKFPVPEAYVFEDAKPEDGFRPAFKLMRLDEKAFSKIRPYSGESDDCEYFGTSPYREPAESPYSVPRVSREVREALSSGKFFGKCRIPELVEKVDAFESESSAYFTEYQRKFLEKAAEALKSGRSLDASGVREYLSQFRWKTVWFFDFEDVRPSMDRPPVAMVAAFVSYRFALNWKLEKVSESLFAPEGKHFAVSKVGKVLDWDSLADSFAKWFEKVAFLSGVSASFAWNASHEAAVIRGLSLKYAWFGKVWKTDVFKGRAEAFLETWLADLEDPFKNLLCYFPEQAWSFSLKAVYPALAKRTGRNVYAKCSVKNGEEAAAALWDCADPWAHDGERARKLSAVAAYNLADVYSMVEIFEYLIAESAGERRSGV